MASSLPNEGNATVTFPSSVVNDAAYDDECPTTSSAVVPNEPSLHSRRHPRLKFSYSPKSHERSYYEGLFRYVASLDDSPSNKKCDVILPPKLAANLFLTSKIPWEGLRKIWNMATAVEESIKDGGDGIGRGEKHGSSRHGNGGNAAGHISEDGNSDSGSNISELVRSDKINNGSSSSKPSVRVMTQSQFQTAVRLIQLFQNRVSPMDRNLNVSKSAVRNMFKDGVVMHGTHFNFYKDDFPPAYFAGVSGIHVALPGIGTRSSGAMIHNKDFTSMRRMTHPIPIHGNETKSNYKTLMEEELSSLQKEVLSLQEEVKGLKAMISHKEKKWATSEDLVTDPRGNPSVVYRGGGPKRATLDTIGDLNGQKGGPGRVLVDYIGSSIGQEVVGSPDRVHQLSKTDHRDNDHANSSNGQDNVDFDHRPNPLKNGDVSQKECDLGHDPKIGVEVFGGVKNPKEDFTRLLPHAVRNYHQRAKNRSVIQDLALSDSTKKVEDSHKNPATMSSNIPSVHPSSTRPHSTILGQCDFTTGLLQSQVQPPIMKLSSSPQGSDSIRSFSLRKAHGAPPSSHDTKTKNGDTNKGFSLQSGRVNAKPDLTHPALTPPPCDISSITNPTKSSSSVCNHDNSSKSSSPTHSTRVKNFSRAHPSKRLTKAAVAQSVPHIVRTTDGHVFAKEKVIPPSTKALDLQPLVPPPLVNSQTTTSMKSELANQLMKSPG